MESGDPPTCPTCRAVWRPVGWSNVPMGLVKIVVWGVWESGRRVTRIDGLHIETYLRRRGATCRRRFIQNRWRDKIYWRKFVIDWLIISPPNSGEVNSGDCQGMAAGGKIMRVDGRQARVWGESTFYHRDDHIRMGSYHCSITEPEWHQDLSLMYHVCISLRIKTIQIRRRPVFLA